MRIPFQLTDAQPFSVVVNGKRHSNADSTRIIRRLMAVSRLLVGIALLFLSGVAHAGDIGTIEGTVTENGAPVKAKIHILRDGFSGVPQVYETVAGAVATPHFLFGAAITFPLTAPGVYSVFDK